MKTLPWLIAGASTAMAWFLMKQPEHATANGAAGETSTWGTKQKLVGTGATLLGKVKKGLGDVTGNNTLKAEGMLDKAAGSVASALGDVAEAAGETLHKMSR